ncbi:MULTISPECIES: hypothetical protein [Sphingomonas]|uniref:hypothetical protein n=1 Tax=Sphingomonas TaxID=13687 RepID=UPI000837096E|nr:hypothetical protein [Sphingomonas sp. CCH10-B3]
MESSLDIIYMTKRPETDTSVLRDRPVLEITDAMVRAGVLEAREHMLGEPLDELVRKVYTAMLFEIMD